MTEQPADQPDEGESELEPVEAEPIGPWPKTGVMRQRSWPFERGPRVEVYVRGEWRRAQLRDREDWPDGTIVYCVDLYIGHTSSYQMYRWNPRSIRPVAPAGGPYTVTYWGPSRGSWPGPRILRKEQQPDAE